MVICGLLSWLDSEVYGSCGAWLDARCVDIFRRKSRKPVSSSDDPFECCAEWLRLTGVAHARAKNLSNWAIFSGWYKRSKRGGNIDSAGLLPSCIHIRDLILACIAAFHHTERALFWATHLILTLAMRLDSLPSRDLAESLEWLRSADRRLAVLDVVFIKFRWDPFMSASSCQSTPKALW